MALHARCVWFKLSSSSATDHPFAFHGEQREGITAKCEEQSMGGIRRRDFLKMTSALGAGLMAWPGGNTAAQPAAKTERPNILVFLTDDHGQWAQHAYGNSELLTPNMNHLAAKGTRMTHAFTPCPVCSPARASLRAW